MNIKNIIIILLALLTIIGATTHLNLLFKTAAIVLSIAIIFLNAKELYKIWHTSKQKEV